MGIESKKFNTRVSSQGEISTGRGEKVSIKLNGNALISEKIKPGTKCFIIHDSSFNDKESSETHIVDVKPDSQNSINNSVKTNSEVVEPLAIFTFEDNDLENFSSSAYQAYFEDRISNTFSQKIISKIQEKNPDEFKKIKEDIEKELKDSENILTMIEEIDSVKEKYDNDLINRNKETIDSFAKKNYDLLNPDSLGVAVDFFGTLDPASIIMKMSINPDYVETKTNTSLVTQLLQFSSYAMLHGVTPVICKEKVFLPIGKNSVSDIIFQGKHSK